LKPKEINIFDYLEGRSVRISRLIGKVEKDRKSHSLILVGGGNDQDTASVLALYHVVKRLKKFEPLLNGNFYALAANLSALAKNKYNLLSRIKLGGSTNGQNKPDYDPTGDYFQQLEEQVELWAGIDRIIDQQSGGFTIIDLRTSNAALPFITTAHTRNNIRFTKKMPVPALLGKNEHFDDPRMDYLNAKNCTALTFYGGKHHDPSSIRNHEAMIWLAMEAAGVMKKLEITGFNDHHKRLSNFSGTRRGSYQINTLVTAEEAKNFRLLPAFKNFDQIKKNEPLGHLGSQKIKSPGSGQLFISPIPNYFYILRKASSLNFNVQLPSLHDFERALISYLPGVRVYNTRDQILIVNQCGKNKMSCSALKMLGYVATAKSGDRLFFSKSTK
jgi:hypothetical protein